MAGSGLLLGWSISSFIVRHQRHDPTRAFIFVATLMMSSAAASTAGVDPNQFLLVCIPWCTCIAMVASMYFEPVERWIVSRRNRGCVAQPGEKAQLMR